VYNFILKAGKFSYSVYTQLQEVTSREQAIYIRTLYKSSILLYMIITESVYYYSHK